MEQEDFFEEMRSPEVPDKMAFQIKANDPDPERTFSKEALDAMFHNLQRFIGARIMAQIDGGTMPKEINVMLDIEWKHDERTARDQVLYPWWSLDSDDGVTPLDGTRRGLGEIEI